MKTPNIFNYATSELSQDAFILWLLDWANPQYMNEDKALCETAQNFVRLLLEEKELKISSVDCKKQENRIDVFAVINDKYALIVEDKTNTSEHDNQIQRYSEWVKREKRYSKLDLHCIYYKTGNESFRKLYQLSQKYADNFIVITRKEVLDLLSPSTTQNSIFKDYVEHIQKLQDQTNAYMVKPLSEWNWLAWQGFYMNLETVLNEGDWGYVANPNGGFLGFWWFYKPLSSNSKVEIYLQFEQDKLCIKGYYKNKDRIGLNHSKNIIKKAKEKSLPIHKPTKLRCGTTMTLAVVELQNFDVLNMPDIIRQLKVVENFINEISCSL